MRSESPTDGMARAHSAQSASAWKSRTVRGGGEHLKGLPNVDIVILDVTGGTVFAPRQSRSPPRGGIGVCERWRTTPG
ncbi:hypothetical protein BL253_13020 [Pseudofrankia asymbiotica]|uniref:Uncharacterized protein n=1 Tax=Pseudofrankia asymbiotica TaxID=1834516 RepID=A0A1V2IBR4_9ACTN|nr:hypothetical protein BL253_13020 [Pseudofrankia asymbiotica]